MKKAQLIALTIFFSSFLIFNLIARKIEFPLFVLLPVILIGGLYFFKKVQFHFGSKIASYGSVGIFLSVFGYIISILFLKQNPILVAVLLMLLAVLSIIFSGFSVYKIFKDKDKFIR